MKYRSEVQVKYNEVQVKYRAKPGSRMSGFSLAALGLGEVQKCSTGEVQWSTNVVQVKYSVVQVKYNRKSEVQGEVQVKYKAQNKA